MIQPIHSVKDMLLKEAIIACTYAHFHTSPNMLYVVSRKASIVYPRQLVIYLLRRYTSYHPTHIAYIVGGIDRSTVLHTTDTITDRLSVETIVQRDVQNICSQINDDHYALPPLYHHIAAHMQVD